MKRAAFVYPLIGLASAMSIPNKDSCCNVPPAPCYPDTPICTYCVGPDLVNPSVRPRMCDGEWVLTAGVLFWNSHQDGMEYVVEMGVYTDLNQGTLQSNNLIDATYQNPKFKWNVGFELGIGYNSTHDGWDMDLHWTHYRGTAGSHIEAEQDDNTTLVALWSAFNNAFLGANLATDIETHWKLHLDLLDATLGREFWTSKYLSLRPFLGLRLSWIDQNYKINHKGGTFQSLAAPNPLNNEVNLSNDFRGIGPRAGLDSTWHLGRGISFYNHLGASLIYGRFTVKHDEWNREATGRHAKSRVLETENHFRAGRAITDLSLGIQWATLFNQCRNHFNLLLSWDHHMFFDQNQLWRVNRFQTENIYYQRRGDLDTQGWTVRASVSF